MNAPLYPYDADILNRPRPARALLLAQSLHNKYTRARSEDNQPYFTHPFAIATLLAHAGYCDERTVGVAAGHDLLDKTPITPSALTRLLSWRGDVDREWAEDVVSGIKGLSDEASFSEEETAYAASLNTRQRRIWKNNRQIEIFFGLPEWAKPVRFGDIIHNAATMSNLSDELRVETHRKGIMLFDKNHWDGNVRQAILASVFFMNINLNSLDNNDDLIGAYGVRAPMPFSDAIPVMIERAVSRYNQKGYPDFSELQTFTHENHELILVPHRPNRDDMLAALCGAPANQLIT